MNRSKFSCFCVVVMLVAINAASALAQKIEVYLGPEDLSTTLPADGTLGAYHVLNINIPEQLRGKTLDVAFLEFFVDASSAMDAESNFGITSIEVFPLKYNLTAEIKRDDLRGRGTFGSVLVGADRIVRIIITDFVNDVIANPSTNNGLAIGSFSGGRDGLFTIKSGRVATDKIAKLIFFYSEPGR